MKGSLRMLVSGRRTRWLVMVVSLMVGAAIWEVVGRMSSRAFFAPFSSTLYELFNMAKSGSLWSALGSSMALFATGLAAGIVAGVPLGLLLARAKKLRVALESYVMLMYVTPMVVLIPFIMSLLGFGFSAKVLVVGLFTFFPMLYNTVEGAKSINPALLEVSYAFRSSEWSLWSELLLPYTLPYIMTGLRQAIGRALVGMVAAEFFLSASGLGGMILLSSRNFELSRVLGAILIIAIIGFLLMQAGLMLERRFASWRV